MRHHVAACHHAAISDHAAVPPLSQCCRHSATPSRVVRLCLQGKDPTLVAGVPQRLPFIVADEIDNLREGAPASLDIRIEQAGELVAEATVAHSRDMVARGQLVHDGSDGSTASDRPERAGFAAE